MEVPESVRIGLASIRPTLHCRWNRQGKVVKSRSLDVNGNPRVLEHEPRWELWDTDEAGNTYKITTLEGDNGEFVQIGEWVIDFFQLINPANYDGDMNKMVEALVDRPNQDVERLGKEAYEEVLEFFADLMWHENSRGSRVSVPSPILRV